MTEENRKNFSGTIRMVIKFAIAAAVIIWFYRTKSGDLRNTFAGFDYVTVIPAFACSVIATFIAALRWRALAALIDIPLTRTGAFSLTMQGLFFSLVIPGGAIGGDVVKMAALTKHVKSGSRTEGIFSILMDRVVGMIALFLLALIMLCFSWENFANLHIQEAPNSLAGITMWWIFSGVCAAELTAGAALFLHRKIEKLPGIKQLMHFADRKSAGKITRLSTAADTYRSNGMQLFFWVAVTFLLIHLLPAVAMMSLLSGSGLTIRFIPVISAVVIGNIAGLLPLFPGGIGARDAVTVALLVSAGYPVAAAGTAQLLSTVILVLFNLTGSIFFIVDRQKPEDAR